MTFKSIIAIIILLLLLILSAGCTNNVPIKQEQPISNKPITQAQKTLIKLIDVNWQVSLGSVLTVVGVFILLNGSSKGVAYIGAGLAAVALAGLTATYFQWLVDYGKYLAMLFGGGIVIGLFYFIYTAADFDGDGDVGWDDVKYLLSHIGKRTTGYIAGKSLAAISNGPQTITPVKGVLSNVTDNTSK